MDPRLPAVFCVLRMGPLPFRPFLRPKNCRAKLRKSWKSHLGDDIFHEMVRYCHWVHLYLCDLQVTRSFFNIHNFIEYWPIKTTKFAQNAKNHDFTSNFTMPPNLHILQPNSKPRRSQYVHTSNFTFSRSNTALGASFEVPRPAYRCMVFQKHSPREASRGTSKLASSAVFERKNVEFEVCTYWERRGLLSGCKICRFGDMARVALIP